MQRLNIELFFALQINEAHRGTGCGFGNALRIPVVVLLRLDIGADIFRRHQSDLMSSCDENPPKVVSAATRFHRNGTSRHLADKLN